MTSVARHDINCLSTSDSDKPIVTGVIGVSAALKAVMTITPIDLEDIHGR